MAGVQPGQECWDMKRSSSGKSVSLFSPNAGKTQLSSTLKCTKSKNRRIRHKKNKHITAIGERLKICFHTGKILYLSNSRSLESLIYHEDATSDISESNLVIKDHTDIISVPSDDDVF